jgi:hypothetical protein
MKKWERNIAPVGLFLAGVLFVVAAVIPTFRGQQLNAAFLPLGIVFAIVGLVAWRKAQRPVPPPAD